MFCHLSNINYTAAVGFHFQFIISPPTAVTRGEAAPLISIMHRTIMHLGGIMLECYPCPVSPETRCCASAFSSSGHGGETGDWGGSLLVPLMSIITPTNLNIIHTAPGLASPPAHVHYTQLLMIAVADYSATLASASHVARYRGITGDTTVDVEI